MELQYKNFEVYLAAENNYNRQNIIVQELAGLGLSQVTFQKESRSISDTEATVART